MKENLDLKNIFKNGEDLILDLSDWQKYVEKKDLEKGYYSEYFKKIINNKEVSIGVFYNLKNIQTIEYVAWGYKQEKDCSYNAKIKENKFLESIISGCPCDDLQETNIEKENYFSLRYLPIYFFLTITFLLSFFVNIFFSTGSWMEFMRFYMAFFFLLFGLLKILNLENFSNQFAKYDPLAKLLPIYGKMYPFIELVLAFCFFINLFSYYSNLLTIVILGITSLGIIFSIANGKKINCACLGGFFNIPIGPITIFENLVMILMALKMLF